MSEAPRKFSFPKRFTVVEVDEGGQTEGGLQEAGAGCPPTPPGCTFVGQIQIGEKLYCEFDCNGTPQFAECT